MFVAVDHRVVGLVAVADPIKPSAAEAIEQLRAAGMRVVMLTGDDRTTADAVARKLGIEEVEARGIVRSARFSLGSSRHTWGALSTPCRWLLILWPQFATTATWQPRCTSSHPDARHAMAVAHRSGGVS